CCRTTPPWRGSTARTSCPRRSVPDRSGAAWWTGSTARTPRPSSTRSRPPGRRADLGRTGVWHGVAPPSGVTKEPNDGFLPPLEDRPDGAGGARPAGGHRPAAGRRPARGQVRRPLPDLLDDPGLRRAGVRAARGRADLPRRPDDHHVLHGP